MRKTESASFGYDVVIWHQNCPWFDAHPNADGAPRFVAKSQSFHDVNLHSRTPANNREPDSVTLFCEKCPAWIYVAMRPVRPEPRHR